MMTIALKMLLGDRAKYFGILMGITFASLLITQQASIFAGLMTRTFGFVTDTGQPDLWVMDSKVQFIDDLKPLQDTELYRVRGVEGVEWAVPMYRGLIRARLENGLFQQCIVVGLDDTTLIGGPPKMIEGKLEDLRRADAVIVDVEEARTKLAKPGPTPDSPKVELKLGDTIELNDRRAVVVGFCSVSRTFQSQPTIYTTYSRALQFAPRERKLLSFVLVGVKHTQPVAKPTLADRWAEFKFTPTPDPDVETVAARIRETTGLAAHTGYDFKKLTVMYFLKNTGIPINFGISVVLGLIVGTAIAGQTFYNFTHDNLKQFGALKAMGAGNMTLLRMILLQAAVVGVTGFGLGVGLAALMGRSAGKTNLAFRLLPHVLGGAGLAVTVICLISATIALIKVMRLEPAIVFKG